MFFFLNLFFCEKQINIQVTDKEKMRIVDKISRCRRGWQQGNIWLFNFCSMALLDFATLSLTLFLEWLLVSSEALDDVLRWSIAKRFNEQ